jgi:AcrR family transcriptional regulator
VRGTDAGAPHFATGQTTCSLSNIMFEYRHGEARRVNNQSAAAVRYRIPAADLSGRWGAMTEQDRRVRRTQRALRAALVALLADRGYERITVQDVLDRADVGRSTFYAHFRDKDALFTSCFDDLRDGLRHELDAMDRAGPPADPTRPVGIIFEHADARREVYRAVCGRRAGNVATRHLHDLLAGLLREHLDAVGTRLPVEIVAEYHASALLGVLVWWVQQDFPYGPAEMSRMCQELTAPGVMASLRASAAGH